PDDQRTFLFLHGGEQPVGKVHGHVLPTGAGWSKQGPKTRSPTIVPCTRPQSVAPAKGELRPRERQARGSTRQLSSGAKSVRSHVTPGSMRASGKPTTLLGRTDRASTSARHESLRSRTK